VSSPSSGIVLGIAASITELSCLYPFRRDECDRHFAAVERQFGDSRPSCSAIRTVCRFSIQPLNQPVRTVVERIIEKAREVK
jgi:hypothetical protein